LKYHRSESLRTHKDIISACQQMNDDDDDDDDSSCGVLGSDAIFTLKMEAAEMALRNFGILYHDTLS
jgi:hypothetical protein